jgi:hypothetical protein
MKSKLPVLLAVLSGVALLVPGTALARGEISASFEITATSEFYEPLAAHGSWIEIRGYGRCWRPVGVAVEWRPYTHGHWEWTDCGWYWVSDEPWGWACYHYGCWVYDPVYYWCWVPDVYWAPAWVTWRVGGGYCGWAPLPPRRAGFFFGVRLAPSAFVFVSTDRFREPIRPNSVIVNNTTIINRTKTITNIRQVERNIPNVGRRRVNVNEGPPLATVQNATGRRIQPVPVQQVVERAAPPASFRQRGPAQERQMQERPGKSRSRRATSVIVK